MAALSNKTLIRIKRSKLNTTIALTTSIVMGVLNFAERTVFNRFFIEEYLGLFSFYNNITGILATVELGITTSIAFALYAPLEYNQRGQIAAIMSFFKKTYVLVGSLIFLGGLAIMPFFPFLIKTSVSMDQVRLYFLFFLLRTASNYVFGYKAILFSANQEEYKTTLVSNISWCVLYSLDIVITITTRNFLLYSISIAVINFMRLIIINLLGDREFGKIAKEKKEKLDPAIKTHIIKNTKGLIVSRIGQVLVNTTDSLLISAMVGVSFLGKYANYQMITTGLRNVATILPNAITASVGNAGVTENRRTMSRTFSTLNLASFLIYSSLTIVLINIFNPIVSTFFGRGRTISMFSVVLICFNFYLTCLRDILFTFKTSLGLYWEDRKRPIVEGLTNLVVSIILGYFWDFDGIILGTIFTNIFVNLTVEPQVIIHSGLKGSAFWYYVTTFGRIALTAGLSIVTYVVNSFLPFTGIVEIVAKAIISLAFICITFYLVYHRNEDAITIMNTLKIAFMDKRKLRKLQKESAESDV